MQSLEGHTLFVKAFGKFVKVTGVFASADAANDFMRATPGHGVIAVLNGIVLVADCEDLGVPEAQA